MFLKVNVPHLRERESWSAKSRVCGNVGNVAISTPSTFVTNFRNLFVGHVIPIWDATGTCLSDKIVFVYEIFLGVFL